MPTSSPNFSKDDEDWTRNHASDEEVRAALDILSRMAVQHFEEVKPELNNLPASVALDRYCMASVAVSSVKLLRYVFLDEELDERRSLEPAPIEPAGSGT